ncbi:MAG: SDR family oxidoreductase [Caldilineae bacterium]|nr:MAG: SDR family oxidoreductase [Caldilineae bacterium]
MSTGEATTNRPLAGAVALVTGGSGDIGSAICRRLAQAGARVVVHYRSSPEKAQAVLESLPGSGHTVVQAAVEESQDIARMVEHVRAHHGRLDILVNNAGFTRYVDHGDLEGLDDDLIDRIMQVNFRAAFACVRAFRRMLEADEGGVVINISSIAGRTGQGSNVAYCASKAAMDSMTRSLGRALAPRIRVVSVAPGLVNGPYAAGFDPAWVQEQVKRTPLGRLVVAEDVAETVYGVIVHMPMTTGCYIPVDGGRPLT